MLKYDKIGFGISIYIWKYAHIWSGSTKLLDKTKEVSPRKLTNGHHFVKNHVKSGRKLPNFKWLGP